MTPGFGLCRNTTMSIRPHSCGWPRVARNCVRSRNRCWRIATRRRTVSMTTLPRAIRTSRNCTRAWCPTARVLMPGCRWPNLASTPSRYACARGPDWPRRTAPERSAPGPFHFRDGRVASNSSGGSAAINFVGTLLECDCKAAESGIEHRTHQSRKRTAFEFIVDKKVNVARAFTSRIKYPAILHALERAIEVFDQNLEVCPVERDAAGKCLADDLVGDLHVGNQDRVAVLFRAAFYSEGAAQRHEVRIFFNSGDQIEHV